MHLVIWAAFRNLDLFSFSLELLITGAVCNSHSQHLASLQLLPAAALAASCWAVVTETMLGVRQWRKLDWYSAWLCGEYRYVFCKITGFYLQNQKLLARELFKGQTRGQPAAKPFSTFRGVVLKGQHKSLEH